MARALDTLSIAAGDSRVDSPKPRSRKYAVAPSGAGSRAASTTRTTPSLPAVSIASSVSQRPRASQASVTASCGIRATRAPSRFLLSSVGVTEGGVAITRHRASTSRATERACSSACFREHHAEDERRRDFAPPRFQCGRLGNRAVPRTKLEQVVLHRVALDISFEHGEADVGTCHGGGLLAYPRPGTTVICPGQDGG